MPNGKDYILFYLKLLLESVDHEGSLRFSDIIPYNEEMLSVVTNTNIDIVRSAMKLFVDLNMIQVLEDRTIYMNEVDRLIGSESWSADRVRRHREKQRLLQCNTTVTSCNEEIDIEIDIDKEIDNNIVSQNQSHSNTEAYKTIVDYLNEKAGTSFKASSKTTKHHINARLIEGYTVEDFKTVIDNKCADWKGTSMEQYLRPITLFGTKFESYLNTAKKTQPITPSSDLDEIF